MTVRIQIRRGTAGDWTTANPVLLAGEQGFETDTQNIKIGDGVTEWNNLSYTFLPTSASNNYLFSSTASAIYLSQESASATYVFLNTASVNYVLVSTASVNYVPNNFQSKGDILLGSGNKTLTTLSVGLDDQILIAASANSGGVKWGSLTSSQIPALDSTKVPTIVANAQTGNYTVTLLDAGKLIEMGGATAQTLTIPTNTAQPFPVGTKIDIIQTGAGECSISPAGGVTLNSEDNKRKLNRQWSAATIIKRATDTWALVGSIKA